VFGALWNVCALCSSALNTELVDNTFPEDDFEVVLGSLEVKWQRIGPYPLCVVVLNWGLLYVWCISTFHNSHILLFHLHKWSFASCSNVAILLDGWQCKPA